MLKSTAGSKQFATYSLRFESNRLFSSVKSCNAAIAPIEPPKPLLE